MTISYRPATGSEVNGTSLRGDIRTSYDEIVAVLGEPHYTDPDPYAKWNCEWMIMTEDGTPFTIYNWKTGGTPTEKTEWHIGGRDMNAVFAAYEVLGMETYSYE